MSAINSLNATSYFAAFSNCLNTSDSLAFQNSVSVYEAENSTNLTPEEEMLKFKQEFYQDVDGIRCHSTVKNVSVNVSDKAFERMKENPQYRAKILSLLDRDLGSSYAPRDTSVALTVGESLEQYRGDSWPISNDSEFWWRSQNSFYNKTDDDGDDEKKKHMEEYLRLLREQHYFYQINFSDAQEYLPIISNDNW